MKNILIPTDFSACAAHAVSAGFQLAEKFNSKVHLIHILTDKKIQKNEEEWGQAVNNAQTLLNDLTTKHPKVETATFVASGKLVQILREYIDTHGIDFLVMGSHGASGKQEYFIGSNTQKAVRSVGCPVLVVKNELPNVDFSKVVFASNFNQEERPAFLKFKEFVKHFLPEIHLVMIHTSSLFDPPYVLSKEAMKEFKELCEPFSCKTHIYRDFTIEKGIRGFAEEIGANLIGISNHYRHPLKRMLIGSNVEALVNHSNLPVLSIDYLEKTKL